MRRVKYFWGLAVLSVFTASISLANADDSGCQASIAAIQQSLQTAFGKANASILIQQGDQELVSASFGTAINSHTRFLLGSVTKTLHATVAVQLLKAGSLDLEDTVGSRLPSELAAPLPTRWQAVKIRNLLHHTSGIPDYLNRNNQTDQHATDTFLKVQHDFSALLAFLPQALEFAPDSQFKYSNTNYLILDRILENVTNLSDRDLLKQDLIAPLNLPDTGTIDQWDPSVHGSTNIFPSNLDGVGNAYSSASDLVTFLKALDGETLLPQSWIQKMFSPDPACLGANCNLYGLGFRLPNPAQVAGHNWVYHQGHLNTVSSMVAKVPDLALNMSVVSDRTEFSSTGLAVQVFSSLIQAGCFTSKQ